MMLALLLGLAPTAPAPAAAQITTPDLATATSRLEGEVDKILRETGIPAISIALVRDGEVAWTGAFGLGTRQPRGWPHLERFLDALVAAWPNASTSHDRDDRGHDR